MPGRLNSFQKTMLQWNELHPYNAIHVAGIRAALEVERLRSTIAAMLEQRGLVRLSLDRRSGTFEYQHDGTAPEIRVVSGTGADALATEIEHQLNTAFSFAADFCPFRFFVTPDQDWF